MPGRLFYFGNGEQSWRESREEPDQRAAGRGRDLAKEVKPIYFLKNTGGRFHYCPRCRKLEGVVPPSSQEKAR